MSGKILLRVHSTGCCGTPTLLFRMILEPIVTANIPPVSEASHCDGFP